MPSSFRTSAVEILEMLSSEESQRTYKTLVPIADVPSELLCWWFDDFYHPTAIFKESFNDIELMALAEFDKFFNKRKQLLPKSAEGLDALLSNKTWHEIMEKARITLAVFNVPTSE